MNAVVPFAFKDRQVRVVQIDGQPWFVAADVCHAIGYKVEASGVHPYLNGLDSDERRTVNWRTLGNSLGTSGGNPTRTLISEAGLYKLIMRAQKARPEVAAFQRWVTHEVLPAIRKDGAYVAGEERYRAGEMSADELLSRAVLVAQRKIERLEAERARLQQENNGRRMVVAAPCDAKSVAIRVKAVFLAAGSRGAQAATTLATTFAATLCGQKNPIAGRPVMQAWVIADVRPISAVRELGCLYDRGEH